MVSGPLHLPTATWGGHMGQFLLSVLILSSSTPLGNRCKAGSIALCVHGVVKLKDIDPFETNGQGV